ncbi:MAG: transcriptional repressor LexA [Patescibacteria group bacterium]|nr:transcriptional repressor LexA [Patescibacteria group bacterium]
MLSRYKEKINKFYHRNKRMPSYSEAMDLLNFKSKNSVFKLVAKLEKEGFLAKDEKGKLIPKNMFFNLKILGSVEAGFPSPAEEELSDTITLDEYLIENKEATFILKVSGDSMKNAGIIQGDMVIVERKTNPKNGDIVIAEVDNEWTIKYFRKIGNKVFLEPANKKYKSIYPKEELKITAIVKAVVRKY